MSVAELRPYEDADLASVVALFNAAARAAYGEEDESEEELRTWFSAPTVDPRRDVRLAYDSDGRLVGYADVYDQNSLHTRYWLDVRVDPERGGHVTPDLLAWCEERAVETARPGAFLRLYVPSRSDVVMDAVEADGFRLIRHSYRMMIDLADRPGVPEWPDGIAVRTMEPGEEEAVYEVDEECFADHWEHVREPFEEWRHWTVDRPDFDPSLWFLAVDGDEIAGYALCSPHQGLASTGWVNNLGVRRPWRRRGLGRALLEHAFAVFRDRGFERAGLGVDAESLTGANRLYERAGMYVARQMDCYQRDVRGAESARDGG